MTIGIGSYISFLPYGNFSRINEIAYGKIISQSYTRPNEFKVKNWHFNGEIFPDFWLVDITDTTHRINMLSNELILMYALENL